VLVVLVVGGVVQGVGWVCRSGVVLFLLWVMLLLSAAMALLLPGVVGFLFWSAAVMTCLLLVSALLVVNQVSLFRY
jgi:hypothetical protein